MAVRYRKVVYCEVGFLKELSKRLNEENTLHMPTSFQEMKVWCGIRNFLKETAIEIHLDITETERDELYKEVEGTIKKAAKKGIPFPIYGDLMYSIFNNTEHVQIKLGHLPLRQLIDEGKELDINAIYLSLLDYESCIQLSKDVGILIISPENIKTFIPLINDNGIAINKNDSGTWDKILRKCSRIPCNSITIVDNYILSQKETFEKNLKAILNSLLPSESKIVFPVTIFSTLMKDSHNGIAVDFFDYWDIVKELIKNMERPYSISLCIVKCSKDAFHDRTVYTNNIWIGCGSGFDLYKPCNIANHSTVINIVSPFINDTIHWAFEAYGNLNKEVECQYRNHESYDNLISRGIQNLRTGMNYKRQEIIEPKIG